MELNEEMMQKIRDEFGKIVGEELFCTEVQAARLRRLAIVGEILGIEKTFANRLSNLAGLINDELGVMRAMLKVVDSLKK